MKSIACLAVCLLCFLALSTRAFAATYVDEMTELENNSFKTYANLVRFPMDSGWGSLPDNSAFGFAATSSPSGRVDYRIGNTRQITVGIYSLGGTFVSHTGDGNALGLYSPDSAASGRSMPQALYSPSAGGVYTRVGGTLHKAYYGDPGYLFSPVDEAPADLIGYGVNVYVSTGGSSYSRLTLTQSRMVYAPGATFCYEEYTASIPSGTAHVRVELNDVGQFPLKDKPGQVQRKSDKRYNLLASVTMEGENLVYGTPEPIVEEPVPSEASSESESSEGSSKAGSRTASSGGGTASASSKFAGSKFEGVIESSTKAANSRAGASSRAAKPASSRSQDQEPTALETPAYNYMEENALYQIPARRSSSKGFTAGVVVYICIVAGALLMVLVKSYKTK